MASKQAAKELRKTCRVLGCQVNLALCGQYCQKKRVCRDHLKADAVQCKDQGDTLWRFCQQCGKLEPLALFEGAKRSCRSSLKKRRISHEQESYLVPSQLTQPNVNNSTAPQLASSNSSAAGDSIAQNIVTGTDGQMADAPGASSSEGCTAAEAAAAALAQAWCSDLLEDPSCCAAASDSHGPAIPSWNVLSRTSTATLGPPEFDALLPFCADMQLRACDESAAGCQAHQSCQELLSGPSLISNCQAHQACLQDLQLDLDLIDCTPQGKVPSSQEETTDSYELECIIEQELLAAAAVVEAQQQQQPPQQQQARMAPAALMSHQSGCYDTAPMLLAAPAAAGQLAAAAAQVECVLQSRLQLLAMQVAELTELRSMIARIQLLPAAPLAASTAAECPAAAMSAAAAAVVQGSLNPTACTVQPLFNAADNAWLAL